MDVFFSLFKSFQLTFVRVVAGCIEFVKLLFSYKLESFLLFHLVLGLILGVF